ncbi:MAG: MFS transporter [Alphaproteobacteria bacterium]|nr:MFS transporter [Alphaproteobacteria bacterium]
MNKLTREQKEAIGLLQIGTFLEYFDLMLYVHMAVLLNELFFPKTDPHTAALVSAFAFCSTYISRPFGALLFGYIGDNIGRKTTVILTTAMMAISCTIMANLPTYAQVGIMATWVVTICRIVQGLSSMGEIIGAQIYISEITKPPVGYSAVAFIAVSAALGSMAAVGVATLATRHGFNWRIAFWIGACIAVVGSMARTRLRETPEFVDMKRRLKNSLGQGNKKNSKKIKSLNEMSDQFSTVKVPFYTSLSYFVINCGWPLSFYIIYFYFVPTLKGTYGYTSEDIIFHNFLLTLVQVFRCTLWSVASYYIHPLRISKFKGYSCLLLMTLIPFWLSSSTNTIHIFLLQVLILLVSLNDFPSQYIFMKNFPIYKRFTATSFSYALGRALTYVITSFGIVYLTDWFDHWGLLVITVPASLGFLASISYFEKLEKLRPGQSGSDPDHHDDQISPADSEQGFSANPTAA